MTITVLKTFFPKQKPTIVKYRNYKKFDLTIFCSELSVKLNTVHCKDRNYESFEKIFVELLNNHAPMKEKYVRANNAPFMNKVFIESCHD